MDHLSPIEMPAESTPALIVRILGETPDEVARWQAYVATAPAATIYHDIAWREIFRLALGYRSYFLVAEDRLGRIRGIFPLYRVPAMFGRPRLVSVPFRDRGGPLFDDPATFTALLDEAKRLKIDIGASHIEFKTIVPYPEPVIVGTGLIRADHWMHSVTSLAGLSKTKLLKAVGDKTRNMIRQAERAGLQVVETDITSAAITSWYRLHQSSQKGLGLPPFPRPFFEKLFADLGPRRLARLFQVNDASGSVIAGCIVLMDRDTAIYAYSVSLPINRHARPNDLMLFRVMCRLIEEGCRRFDFGADSPSQSGLLFFKRKWLAEQTTIPRYYVGEQAPEMIDSSAGRFELVRSITRRLPLPIARATLAPLVRYFG
ncbi:GNAT family N-acetyltransferase [Bradyrhizobium sediminis]|uniref:GNAT family N-acetyltransferase n=1 Tax=Bradyrhizobium sediminis TaxID=2840469 RepID=A0A975NI43_9BRAD|nr:GNAT family N-acetyltransferase [Bradyrhizobium sediminis]QWG14874.1 GNAT family N-acetyltransferase [Bradyrhizobium sediminis]